VFNSKEKFISQFKSKRGVKLATNYLMSLTQNSQKMYKKLIQSGDLDSRIDMILKTKLHKLVKKISKKRPYSVKLNSIQEF